MTTTDHWLAVDRAGLRKLIEDRGKEHALYDLIQNAWDGSGYGKVSEVHVTLEPADAIDVGLAGEPLVKVTVTDDDPDGFFDLTHAYTMYAESEKKGDERQRGRFNEGEKLVLALCTEARVRSTKGAIHFRRDGEREQEDARTDRGSVFEALMMMTEIECRDVVAALRRLLSPQGIRTVINGEELDYRPPAKIIEGSLPTVKADENGTLRRTTRKTAVHIHEPKAGEKAWLFECGIPVVETGDRFHVDVQQKVPLNRDRDNVTPAYLREVRTLVLNSMAHDLDGEETTETWVREAMANPKIDDEALRTVVTKRFGKNVAAFDPNDLEANNRFAASGGSVVGGRTFNRQEWENIRRAGAIPTAGSLMPTTRLEGDPSLNIPEDEWRPGMHVLARWSKAVAENVIGGPISVCFINKASSPHGASYGDRSLCYNVGRLGWAFVDGSIGEEQVDLLIHELGHEYESNHLSDGYYKALTKIGAKVWALAIEEPGLFDPTNFASAEDVARSMKEA